MHIEALCHDLAVSEECVGTEYDAQQTYASKGVKKLFGDREVTEERHAEVLSDG
jgi:hypothetical protein